MNGIYIPIKTGTLLMPSGTENNPDLKHLFIICTDADGTGQHLLVNVTTWRNDFCDPSCILEADTHEFITAKSYILYRKARIETAQTLLNGVQNGTFFPKECLEQEHFENVCKWIVLSPHTPRGIKQYYLDVT